MYSDLVMDHFRNPRNVGELADADGVGQVGNPVCGDVMKLMIKVKDERIEDVKFQTFGCGAAIATSSMVEVAMKAADLLAEEGIAAEVVDPCTLFPLDRETLLESVRKTGYAVVVERWS